MMDKKLIELAKTFSNGLMEQIYFIHLMKESEIISNNLQKYELGAGTNDND